MAGAALTEAEARFLQAGHYAVIAALRPDGTAHQTVVWVDWDGTHVLVNLNTERRKLDYLGVDPRTSVLVLHREDPFRWLSVDGVVDEITTEGANEHIDRQAKRYFGRDVYGLKPGEQRVLVKVRPTRVHGYRVD